jgi:hypothetical protein
MLADTIEIYESTNPSYKLYFYAFELTKLMRCIGLLNEIDKKALLECYYIIFLRYSFIIRQQLVDQFINSIKNLSDENHAEKDLFKDFTLPAYASESTCGFFRKEIVGTNLEIRIKPTIGDYLSAGIAFENKNFPMISNTLKLAAGPAVAGAMVGAIHCGTLYLGLSLFMSTLLIGVGGIGLLAVAAITIYCIYQLAILRKVIQKLDKECEVIAKSSAPSSR